jgi:methyl-accepting chemotaxis protein
MKNSSSIRRSMLIGAGLLALVAALAAVFTAYEMRLGSRAAGDERRMAREVSEFKDVRYHAIQVQQFMTDAAATGDRGGVDDAREHARAALAGLETLARDDASVATAARQLGVAVESLVGTGETMVDAYLARGREAGNAVMKRTGGFDDQADAIATQVAALARDLDARAGAAEAAALAAGERTMRFAIGALLLFGLVITAMLSAMHVQLRRALTLLRGSIDACRGTAADANAPVTAMPREFAEIASACNTLFAELRAERDAQAAAARSTARVKAALDRVSTSVLIADVGGAVIYANDAARDFFRAQRASLATDADRLVGESLATLMRLPDAGPAHRSTFEEAHGLDMRLGAADIRVDATPVDDADGRRLGIAVQWVDRTDEARTEREVQHVVACARAGDLTQRVPRDGKSGFFGALADGLNALIDGIAQLVERDVAPVVARARTGDLTSRVPRDGKQGFFLALADGLNDVLDNTAKLVSTAGATATEVAGSAGEIATGNTHLSSRTESLASALAELTHSMSELATTVRHNADSAREASRLAVEARSHAERGGKVASSANAAMSGINDSSRRIQDIIVVIDEIAFQTNLLALNAAVEAARAGEQGRGFAVVAGEVRNLASRSADAAKEIKSLIQDSVTRVDEGSRLVDECGRALGDIVGSVQRVAGIVSEIAAASGSQAAGVEEASRAVAGMDENTQQNAALVEETAAAAESLQERAAELQGVLASYRIAVAAEPTATRIRRGERAAA